MRHLAQGRTTSLNGLHSWAQGHPWGINWASRPTAHFACIMQTILDLQALENHLTHIPLSALLGIDSVYCAEQSDQMPNLPSPGKCDELPGSESHANDGQDLEQNSRMPKRPVKDSVTARNQVRDWTKQAFESNGYRKNN